MKFLPLLNLHLLHPYYTDVRCPDFSVAPTPATQRLLKNHRCLLKARPNGVQVLMTVTGEGSQFIPLAKGMKFTFHLQLQNPDFPLFTDMTAITQALNPTYSNADLSNAALDSENPLPLALISPPAWATERFTVRQPAPEDRFTLSGRPLLGRQEPDFKRFKIEGLGAISSPIAYAPTAKIITINTKNAAAGDAFTLTYEITPQRARGVFAAVEIIYQDPWPEIAAGPAEFQIAFKAKEARWKYYIIADSANTRFSIRNQGESGLAFSDKNQTNLNREPDSSDEIAQALAEQYPQMSRLRFVSDDLIPCRQAARKSLQLRMAGSRIMESLPNPSLQNYTTTDIIQAGIQQQEDVLYQIVKYFTHQFQTAGG